MKCLIAFFILLAVSNAVLRPDISKSFNWTAGGSYSGSGSGVGGNYQTRFPYPINGLTSYFNGSLFVDVVRHVIAIKAPGHAEQYATDSGFYIVIPAAVPGGQLCLYNGNVDYNTYVDYYTEALNNDLVKICDNENFPNICIVRRIYSGLVRDPGACDCYISTNIKTQKNDLAQERVVSYTIDQIVYLAAENLITKYYGLLEIDTIVDGVAASDVQLPTVCTASPPLSYCAFFFKPGQNCTLAK